MEKLANLSFVVKDAEIEDTVKIAAIENYFRAIDALGSDEEKVAALEGLDELLKNSSWAGLGKWLANLGGKIGASGQTGGTLSRLGGWLGTKGDLVSKWGKGGWQASKAGKAYDAWKASKGAVGQAAKETAAKGTTFSRLRNLTDAAVKRGQETNLGNSRLLNWAAKHPAGGKLLIGGGIAGGSLLGGGLYGKMRTNEAYKQGYGQAVGQLSPMVSSLYAPQGAMGVRM